MYIVSEMRSLNSTDFKKIFTTDIIIAFTVSLISYLLLLEKGLLENWLLRIALLLIGLSSFLYATIDRLIKLYGIEGIDASDDLRLIKSKRKND